MIYFFILHLIRVVKKEVRYMLTIMKVMKCSRSLLLSNITLITETHDWSMYILVCIVLLLFRNCREFK